MSQILIDLALLLVAYLFGSIPTGYLVGRWLKGIDIRDHGSGSTGATNVLRTLGKGPGAAVLLIDVLKGALAIGLIKVAYTFDPTLSQILGIAWMETLAGLAALLGHSKSLWLGFTGGKSVATGLGLLLALSWWIGLSAFGVFGVTLALSRIVSLGSIAAAIAVGVLMVGFQQPLPYQLLAIAGGLYVVWRHRTNIQRLMSGQEPRLGQKLETPSQPQS